MAKEPQTPLLQPEMPCGVHPRLPREILIAIFENLEQESQTLRSLRLVSRQFEDLAVPIAYRHVTLTARLVAAYVTPREHTPPQLVPSAHSGSSVVIARNELLPLVQQTPFHLQMSIYTKHVTVDREFEWFSAGIMLRDLDNLQSIRWSYWDNSTRGGNCENLPFEFCRDYIPKVDLLIEGMNISSNHGLMLALKRPLHLTSFKAALWKSHDYALLKPALMRRPEMKTLHLIGQDKDSRLSTRWFLDHTIGRRDRMPPVEQLFLENYHWNHSPAVATNFWNWINLRSLHLIEVCMNNFLTTVPVDRLLNLHTLVLEDACKRRTEEATDRMCNLVYQIRALKTLGLKCKMRQSVTTIIKHGSTLRMLSLYDYNRVRTSDLWTTLSTADVQLVARSCPHLMELSIDAYFSGESKPPHAFHMEDKVLSSMRNLRRLMIYTRAHQTKLPMKQDGDSYRVLHDRMCSWLHNLLTTKQGASFEKIQVDMMVFKVDGDDTELRHRSILDRREMSWNYGWGEDMGEPTIPELGTS